MTPLVLVNGVPNAMIPPDDPAVTQGMAVFDVARTYANVPFRLAAHLARLADSAAYCGIAYCKSLVEIEIDQALAMSSGDRSLSVTLTAGGNRIVRVAPIDAARVGAPVRLASFAWTPATSLPGFVKHTARAPWLLAARAAQVDEVLLTDSAGNWTEANRSNIFVLREGRLFTPPTHGGILSGITRAALIQAAAEMGIRVEETLVPSGPTSEFYVSSTLKQLAPVIELDGQRLPAGGPVGELLKTAFSRIVARECPEQG